MRPKAIFTFERLGLMSILLSAVQVGRLAATGRMTPSEVTLGVITTLVSVALVLFASRGRSRIALWILTALTLIGIAAAGYSLSAAGGAFDVAQVVDLVAIALQAAAVAFAWTAASRAWFSQEDVAAA